MQRKCLECGVGTPHTGKEMSGDRSASRKDKELERIRDREQDCCMTKATDTDTNQLENLDR